eukprot:1142382-Pelagomonas_calceolata.AAC.7
MHTEQHRTGHRATRYWKQSNTGLDTEQHGTGHRATRKRSGGMRAAGPGQRGCGTAPPGHPGTSAQQQLACGGLCAASLGRRGCGTAPPGHPGTSAQQVS